MRKNIPSSDKPFHTISPWCRIFASANRVNIGSDNDLSPIRRQAIISTSAGLLSVAPLATNFGEICTKLFIHENASENIVCEKATILSRGEELRISLSILFYIMITNYLNETHTVLSYC